MSNPSHFSSNPFPQSAEQLSVCVIMLQRVGDERFEQALCSVLDQSSQHIDLVTISPSDLEDYERVTDFYRDDLAGAVEIDLSKTSYVQAVNTAIRNQSSDYVLILDGRAMLLPGYFDRLAYAIKHASDTLDKQPLWFGSHAIRVDSQQTKLGQLSYVKPDSLESFIRLETGMPQHAIHCYHRSVFDTYGLFDTSLNHAWQMSFDARLVADALMPTIFRGQTAVVTETLDHYEWELKDELESVIALGRDLVEIAYRWSDRLPLTVRNKVLEEVEERQAVYDLAALALQADTRKQYLWVQMLRRPGWLSSSKYRRTLLNEQQTLQPRQLSAA